MEEEKEMNIQLLQSEFSCEKSMCFKTSEWMRIVTIR